jgi:hypothetical protein
MKHLGWTVARVLTAVLVTGCGAGWHQVAPLATKALPLRQQVQVWRAGGVLRWHAVRVSGDSVSGIPYLQAIACDSCRTGVARAGVDSLRLGSPVAGFWKTIGLITGAFVLAGVIYCWRGCSST